MNLDIPRHWRLKAQRYRLEGSVCPACGQVSFPPRRVCPHTTAQPVWIASIDLATLQVSNRIYDIAFCERIAG